MLWYDSMPCLGLLYCKAGSPPQTTHAHAYLKDVAPVAPDKPLLPVLPVAPWEPATPVAPLEPVSPVLPASRQVREV